MNGVQTITDFDRRVRNVYALQNKVTYKQACTWFDKGKWGAANRVQHMELIEDFAILNLYLAVHEWKAWEQNTFFLEYDDNGCPIWQYPSTVVDPVTLDCIIKHFNYQCSDIRNMLRKFGIWPVGVKPDGIDYMHIEEGTLPCDNNIFQINKTYGNDVDPQ